MGGTICVVSNDTARYSFFAASLTSIQAPPDTSVRWRLGSDRIRGRNTVVREALETGAEWVWFLDDDQAFQSDLLMRLLSHEVDIITPVYMQRVSPFAPVVYTDRSDDGTYEPLFLHDYPVDTGLIEVRAAGTGGLLIRTEVFDFVAEPWFEYGEASEDLMFCERARDAGYKVHCDLQAHLGHGTTASIWPTVTDGKWAVGVTLPDMRLALPIEQREPAEVA